MALAGLILHASRCGSTVLLNALRAWPGVVVVDEPPALDDALYAARVGDGPERLDAVLAELGARGERVIVKTDTWHVLEVGRLRAACPSVPWLFLHRDPAEILVSHLREPGSHTVPGVLSPVWFGPPRTVIPAEHAAAVLAAIFTAATPHVDAVTMLDYAELPDAITARVAGHFGLAPCGADPAALAAVLGRHAKRPYETFRDDRAAKRAAVTAPLAALVAREIAPAYEALLRRRQVAA